jgi:hypothetical protein
MDFIERIFGISPDGGDGSAELLVFTIFIAACLLISLYLYRKSGKGFFGHG